MPATLNAFKVSAGSGTRSVTFSAAEAPAGSLLIAFINSQGNQTLAQPSDVSTNWTGLGTTSGGTYINAGIYARILSSDGVTVSTTTGASTSFAQTLIVAAITNHGGVIPNSADIFSNNTNAPSCGSSLATNANGGGPIILGFAMSNYSSTKTLSINGMNLIQAGNSGTGAVQHVNGLFTDTSLGPNQSAGPRTLTTSGAAGSPINSAIAAVVVNGEPYQIKTGTESATGDDTATVGATNTVTDSGLGDDPAIALSIASDAFDTALGDDSAALSILADDSGIGSEAVTDFFQGEIKNATDSGAGDDTAIALSAESVFSDSATGTDTSDVLVIVSGTDSGVGSDSGYVVLPVADSGLGEETFYDLFPYFGVSDEAIGTETSSTFVQITVTDEGVGYDIADEPREKEVWREDWIDYSGTRFYTQKRFRVLAQNIFTKQWVHNDLPLIDPEITYQYTSPHLFRGTIKNEVKDLQGLYPDLDPESTWLYPEEDGNILGSFILLPFVDSNGEQKREVEGVGFSAYPHWLEYTGDEYKGIQVDPGLLVQLIWGYIQNNGYYSNLGVSVPLVSTPVRLGTAPKNVEFTTGEGEEVSFEAGPWDLNWWEVSNLGQELDKLFKDTPMEYIERSAWNKDKTDVGKLLDVRYPRIGTRLDNVQFREGENLIEALPGYNEIRDGNPSDIIVVGAGEGQDAIRGYVARQTGKLRRTKVIQNEKIKTRQEAQALADQEARRIDRARYGIESIVVNIAHPNAQWGTFMPGDDVYIQGKVIYRGQINAWFRIESFIYRPGKMRAELSLAASDTFAY